MSSLMIGVSGVRGIVGESLTPELLIRLGQAFGTYVMGGPVVVGRDTRVTGEMVKHSVFGGLLSTGCSIVDVGVCATPTTTLMIEELGAAGGIVISASHNPAEWNALKFFRSDGFYLNDEEGRNLLDIYYQGDFTKARFDGFHDVTTNGEAQERHVKRALELVDVGTIRQCGFSVALDCCNGAGVAITRMFLEELGCKIHPLHCTPDGLFPHDPEPTFVNLQDICDYVRDNEVDVGFAVDPDADRVAIIGEDGAFIGEEYTLGLATDYHLRRMKGPVVTNVSTTRAIDDIAHAHGCECSRTPVGEVNVATRMKQLSSPIGGEGNGGVIDPRLHYGRDAIVGIGMTLEYMAISGRRVTELASKLPRYHMLKSKVDCHKSYSHEIVRRLATEGEGDRTDLTDGLKIEWADSWVHLRASNTEPVMRIIAEAKTEQAVGELVGRYGEKVADILAELTGGNSATRAAAP